LNVGSLTKSIYIKKLKGRLNTLLIPYLFWNIALLVLLFLISLAPSFSSFLNKKPELSITYLLHALWDGNSGYPISYQFWFIRDLMVMVLLTPLVYLYIKYLKSLGIFLLGIFWFCNYWFHIQGLSIAAIFLFTAGAWFSINEKSLLIDSKKISNTLFIAYPIFIVIDFITKNNNYNVFIHNAGNIIGLLFWFSLVQK